MFSLGRAKSATILTIKYSNGRIVCALCYDTHFVSYAAPVAAVELFLILLFKSEPMSTMQTAYEGQMCGAIKSEK